MRVYNVLGSGFVEPIYQEALEIEFQRRNIPFVREPNTDLILTIRFLTVKIKG